MGKMKYLPVFMDNIKTLSVLTDEQFGRVIRAALEFMDNGTVPELEPIEMIGFQVVKEGAMRSAEKYNERCKANQDNANKRWQNNNNANDYRIFVTVRRSDFY